MDVNMKRVEVEPDGVPSFTFPPFPDPPEGVKIVPFSEFKPSGIQISLGDEEEVDGLGIPTVGLAVTHDNDAPPKKKRKTKKTPTDGEPRRKTTWWEEWEEGEQQRIQCARPYDKALHPKSRIAEAVDDFRRIHDWQAPSLRLLEWYGKLLYFLGLNDVHLRSRFRRHHDEDQRLEDEDDAIDADDADSATGQQPEPAAVRVEKFDEAKHEVRQNTVTAEQEASWLQKVMRIKETQEIRLDAFVDNPHLAAKIFLSSYFRDSGMMWEKSALRDAPRVFEFFLNFLLQTRALFEEELPLKRALDVTRKAKEELPLTMEIGQSMPDELAQCLKAVYGSRLKKLSLSCESDVATADSDFKAQTEENGGVITSDLVPGPLNDAGHGVGTSGLESAELHQVEETTTGWSSIGVGASNWGGAPNISNGGDDVGEDLWGTTNQSDDEWASDPHFLMSLLGPTTLPFTHTIGYVEDSTRYITSVSFPETSNTTSGPDDSAHTTSNLFHSFARVVLNPYPTFAAPSAPRATIQPPELIEDPWKGISLDSTEKPRIPKHDPKKDSITMLVDVELGKLLDSGKHMGLGGTFVQVVPNSNDSASVEDELSGKAQTTEETSFWYAEKILQVIPSYWTERQV